MSSRASVDDHRARPPPLQTLIRRPSTAPHSGTPKSAAHREPPPPLPNGRISKDDSPKTGHQHFVLTDPVAFRYLEEDPATSVVQRAAELQGYECYVVEQWATSRTHPTFTLTAHTGDSSSSIIVGVLSVPTDEATWSPRLRVYFKALNQYKATRRKTPLGILMVTNLSGISSSLTVIQVPGGDLKKYRLEFFVNENLKRLGCSGRVGLALVPPTGATIAKFHQIYHTSDKNEVYKSVIELVKLCQSALMLFDKLEVDYADGLLCDVTERAIQDWWLEIGGTYFNVESLDGILGPTTVAGLLGLLMGARNRLHAVNAPVSKDAFDIQGMKKGISAFQKQQRIPRTRRLDRKTLDRLHKSTIKAANSDGFTIPKAVKSTVAELSGKGGEMVMEAVGRRDRAGIAEIETCDIDRFVQLVYGEKPRWLWWGRPLKKTTLQTSGPQDDNGERSRRGFTFREDEHGGFTWTARKSTAEGLHSVGKKDQLADDLKSTSADEEDTDPEGAGFRGVLKRSTGFKEAKSGLGRFKGAVGLGTNHSHKVSKDESRPRPQTPQSPVQKQAWGDKKIRPRLSRSYTSPTSSPRSAASSGHDRALDAIFAERSQSRDNDVEQSFTPYERSPEAAARTSQTSLPPFYTSMEKQSGGDSDRLTGPSGLYNVMEKKDESDKSETATLEPSVAGSVYYDAERDEMPPISRETERDASYLLRRTLSDTEFEDAHVRTRSDDSYPRHLSFSLVEESVLTWVSPVQEHDDSDYSSNDQVRLAQEEFVAKETKHLQKLLNDLSATTAPWTNSQLESLNSLLDKISADERTADELYHPQANHINDLQSLSEGVLRDQKERLEEEGKETETLAAKLEYEIGGLESRVLEVGAGVGDFERSVRRVEERVRELEREAEKAERGWGCIVQ